MNEKEKTAVRKEHLALLDDLDVDEILPYLYQNMMISFEEYEKFKYLSDTRRDKCEKLLFLIKRSDSKCTFVGFLEALRYNNVYGFLADNLEKALDNVLKSTDGEDDEKELIDNTLSDTPHTATRSDVLYKPVNKINVFTKNRKILLELAHKLKRLSHNGDCEGFKKVQREINRTYERNKLNTGHSIKERMKFADMKFTSIDEEIGAKRVRYEADLIQDAVFRDMESIIPFTSNPRVSSMVYLARYGSAVAMKDPNFLDDGLAFIQYAKEHSEHVMPCKDTGMVYYIEVNLLFQKYEQNPTDELKVNILKTSEHGIAQFNDEMDDIRKDYQRMLLLKMVFCYLGMGLFCKKIEKADTTPADREEAKKVIDFMEKSEVWHGMEKRRKMLFFFAKSEYYKQLGNMELSILHAHEAEKLGKENKWEAELQNISNFLVDIDNAKEFNVSKTEFKEPDDIIAELLGDLSETGDEMTEYMSAEMTQFPVQRTKSVPFDIDETHVKEVYKDSQPDLPLEESSCEMTEFKVFLQDTTALSLPNKFSVKSENNVLRGNGEGLLDTKFKMPDIAHCCNSTYNEGHESAFRENPLENTVTYTQSMSVLKDVEYDKLNAVGAHDKECLKTHSESTVEYEPDLVSALASANQVNRLQERHDLQVNDMEQCEAGLNTTEQTGIEPHDTKHDMEQHGLKQSDIEQHDTKHDMEQHGLKQSDKEQHDNENTRNGQHDMSLRGEVLHDTVLHNMTLLKDESRNTTEIHETVPSVEGSCPELPVPFL